MLGSKVQKILFCYLLQNEGYFNDFVYWSIKNEMVYFGGGDLNICFVLSVSKELKPH